MNLFGSKVLLCCDTRPSLLWQISMYVPLCCDSICISNLRFYEKNTIFFICVLDFDHGNDLDNDPWEDLFVYCWRVLTLTVPYIYIDHSNIQGMTLIWKSNPHFVYLKWLFLAVKKELTYHLLIWKVVEKGYQFRNTFRGFLWLRPQLCKSAWPVFDTI